MTPETYEDWRTARAGCITASQFRRVMDAKTPRAWRTLVADIKSEAAAIEQGIFVEQSAPALEWGKSLEPRAIANYELTFARDVEPAPFVRLPGLPVGCSPDGLVGDCGLIECKCPFSMDGFDRYVREKGEAARWQILGQLWITGREWCDLVVYDPRRADYDRLWTYRFTADDNAADIARLRTRVEAFARCLTHETDPAEAFKEAV